MFGKRTQARERNGQRLFWTGVNAYAPAVDAITVKDFLRRIGFLPLGGDALLRSGPRLLIVDEPLLPRPDAGRVDQPFGSRSQS
jgi:hypothetical protein